jgi:hypothetical protein
MADDCRRINWHCRMIDVIQAGTSPTSRGDHDGAGRLHGHPNSTRSCFPDSFLAALKCGELRARV